MPAQSQQQQKLFGLALSVKRGDTPRSDASEEVLKIVDSMTEKEIEDFAGTEHEGLPKKVEQKIREMTRQTIRERMIGEAKFNKGDMVRVVDNPKYVMDKKKFAGMSGYVKNIIGRDIQVTFPNGRTIMVAPKDLEMNPNESVNEGDTLRQVKKGNSIILKRGNKIYATISQNPNKEYNWTVYFQKGPALSGYKTKEDAIARAQKMSDSLKSVFNKIKGESVNEAQKVNPTSKKFLKGMKKIKVKGLGGYMPGVDYVYVDSDKYYFVDFEGDHMELKNISTIKQLHKLHGKSLGESVNEANGEFVVYVEKDNGRKKLLHTKKSQRAANMFMSKNVDKILNKSGIRSIGSMSKDQWEKKEAQFAENIKKSDMKTVTKKEWDRTHKDYKGMIKGQPYMMYLDKKTNVTKYGPVQIKG